METDDGSGEICAAGEVSLSTQSALSVNTKLADRHARIGTQFNVWEGEREVAGKVGWISHPKEPQETRFQRFRIARKSKE
ncbi:MAG: hypothetical protein DWI24_10805 [Planctomycetota bacterium]|nr:MAG: hypothetical protein DWI24_10805 [Planctomycetota bacterium]